MFKTSGKKMLASKIIETVGPELCQVQETKYNQGKNLLVHIKTFSATEKCCLFILSKL